MPKQRMSFTEVQCSKSDAVMARRMSEQYSMPKSNSQYSHSSDSSVSSVDVVYHELRQNVPIQIPFRMNSFMPAENVPVSQRRVHIRPNSMANCIKCNQIRTNPRFRPSSFQSDMQSKFLFSNGGGDDDDESSEDQVSFQKPSFPKNRRRFRYRNHAR